MNGPLYLNPANRASTVAIFAHGVRESALHIRKITSSGRNLFSRQGIEITLGMAIKRRRRCIQVIKQALRGFIL